MLQGDVIEVLCREVTVIPPVIHRAKHVFEQARKRSSALSPIEGLIAGVAFVLVAPIGRGGELLEEIRLGAREAAGALEGRGGLTGAVAGRDQLRQERVDIVSVRVHAIPDGHDAEEGHGENHIERREGTPTQAPERTTGKRHRGERSGGDDDSLSKIKKD